MSQLDNHGYEQKDATFKPVFLSALGIFAILALGMILVSLFFSQMEKRESKKNPSTDFMKDERWQAPALQLETHPTLDYKAFKKEEDKKIASYGWVDASTNKVSIPLDEAMKRALEKGFETRQVVADEIIVYEIPLESGGMKKGKG